jgi:hypothetical protein
MSSNAFNELDRDYNHAQNLREHARWAREQDEQKTAKTVTVQGFIHAQKCTWTDKVRYDFFKSEDMTECGYVLVGPHEITLQIPADFNIAAGQISALQKQKDKLHKEFNVRLAQINDEISKLQCLEFTPSEAQ